MGEKVLHENSVIDDESGGLLLGGIQTEEELAVLEFNVLFILHGDLGWERFESSLIHLTYLKGENLGITSSFIDGDSVVDEV